MNLVHWLVDRMHVSASDRDVVREFWRRFKHLRGRRNRRHRKKVYRIALRQHAKNRKLYRYVMEGKR